MKDQPLQCSVEDDELVIRIGIDTLAFAFLKSDDNNRYDEALRDWRPEYGVIDEAEFANDVALAMNHEAEDGGTPLSSFLDKMMQAALDDGSQGIMEISEIEEMRAEQIESAKEGR